MKNIFLPLVCLLHTLIHAYPSYIPFNPALNPDGTPLKVTIKETEGIIGFLEDAKYNLVPALKVDDVTFYTIINTQEKPTFASFPSRDELNGWLERISHDNQIGLKLNNFVNPPLGHWNAEDKKDGKIFRPWLFYNVMGVTESYFKSLTENGKNLDLFPLPGHSNFDSLLQHFPGRQGLTQKNNFTLHTIKDLRDQAKAKLKADSHEPGKFIVINSYDLIDSDIQKAIELTDIRAQIANPANQDAVFQLASTFDCLEGGVGEFSSDILHMLIAPVQGEEAALATMGATIVRKYYEHNNAIAHGASISPNNLLKDLHNKRLKLFPYRDKTNVIGNTIDTAQSENSLPKGLTTNDIDNVYIGWHADAPVTSGYETFYNVQNPFVPGLPDAPKDRIDFLQETPFYNYNRNPINIFNKFPLSDSKKQTVNLALTAAYNISHKPETSSLINTAKVLLKASYLGTIYKAFIEGKKKVYLTLMGAGAFGNKLEWIGEILSDPELIDFIKKSGLEVYLNIFADPRIKTGKADDRDQRKKPDYQAFLKTINSISQQVAGIPVETEPSETYQALAHIAESLQQFAQESDTLFL